MRRLWLWRVARTSFVLAVALIASPVRGSAAVQLGDVQFTWAHLLVLVALGAAWGDMRAQTRVHSERIKEIIEELHELRKNGGKR